MAPILKSYQTNYTNYWGSHSTQRVQATCLQQAISDFRESHKRVDFKITGVREVA